MKVRRGTMNSKDYEILVNRLKEEIKRNYESILEMQNGSKVYDERMINIHRDYISYHKEVISLIIKLDKELK